MEVANTIAYTASDWYNNFDKKIEYLPTEIEKFFLGIAFSIKNASINAANAIAKFSEQIYKDIERIILGTLVPWVTNAWEDIVKTYNWVIDVGNSTSEFMAELLIWVPFRWASKFAIGVFLIQFEILKDMALAYQELILTAIPNAVVGAITGMPGFELIPAVDTVRKYINDIIKGMFKVGGSILTPDIGKAIEGALNEAAKELEKGFKSIFGL